MDDGLFLANALIFALALIFTAFGLNSEKAQKVTAYMIATVLWFIMAILFPTTLNLTSYWFLGWAFMIPAVYTALESIIGIYSLYSHIVKDDWEKESLEEA